MAAQIRVDEKKRLVLYLWSCACVAHASAVSTSSVAKKCRLLAARALNNISKRQLIIESNCFSTNKKYKSIINKNKFIINKKVLLLSNDIRREKKGRACSPASAILLSDEPLLPNKHINCEDCYDSCVRGLWVSTAHKTVH